MSTTFREFLQEQATRHQAEGNAKATIERHAGCQRGKFLSSRFRTPQEQGRVSADLITQVDQVRQYRNWVAHGRRDYPEQNVTPKMAFDRLGEFLAVLGINVEAEQDQR